MKLRKSDAEMKEDCNNPPKKVFAWTKKRLDDGSIVWLEFVWEKKKWSGPDARFSSLEGIGCAIKTYSKYES